MKAYITELIGTFFLVLSIGLAVTNGTSLAPITIGATLMVMVYMGGHVSGGHYNPAVTLGVCLRGALLPGELVPYWVAQFVGALLAAVSLRYLTGDTFAPAPAADATALQALVAEFFYTFALVLVVLNTATSSKTEGNSYYGLAIGFTVAVGAATAGPISGGAFNPAVGVGPALVQQMFGLGALGNVWIYLVGPLAGGAVAALVFAFQEGIPAERA